MNIRNVVKEDLAQLVGLCEAHAIYEQSSYVKEGKEEQLKKAFFTEGSLLNCWVVVDDSGILFGYATAIKQYSTWDADWYLYLDCLFLVESLRGKGFGELLMQKVLAFAKDHQCMGVQWQTPTFNEGAIRFYKRLGAVSKSKERFFWS